VSIWGHDVVVVEKDPTLKQWKIFTSAPRGKQQHLVTIPWADAYKSFTPAQYKQYPDYTEAIATCQAHEDTALTDDEEFQVLREIENMEKGTTASVIPSIPAVDNVVSLADFRKRRK